MAIWYVRPGGTGSGTGPALNQAWGTFQDPFTSGSGVTGGDTVYIAPGHYNEKITVTITNPTSTVSIIGDVTASQFSGLSAGLVRLSTFSSAGTTASTLTAPVLSATTKDFLSFSNIIFEGNPTSGTGSNLVRFITSKNMSFTKCIFVNEVFASATTEPALLYITPPASVALGLSITKCVFMVSGRNGLDISGNNVADTSSITDTLFQGATTEGLTLRTIQMKVQNCTFMDNGGQAIRIASGSSSFPSSITNCLFYSNATAIASLANNLQTENFNRFIGNLTNRTSVDTGTSSSAVGASRLDYGYSRIVGLNPIDFYGPQANSPNQAFGTSTGAEATDVMSIAWTGVTPDSGYQTYSTVATLSPTYNPTERNASTITIAPGSTSQSIELYLGVTGLTASTSGLSAYYNRTRTADVQITLVARTIGQAWTSGGFAEVNASTMPGVYRLDLPDAAVAAGADDVTVVVRGASGTNGAVMTIKLSSGGLTAAQTASAILDAVGASYVTAGSIGYAIQNGNVASISGSTAAADELEGALLHNGTDYISAQLIAGGGGGAGDVGGNIINLNEDPEVVVQSSAWVGDWHTYVLRLVDSNGTPYDITNDTLAVTFTNVATGSAYAFGGGSATITKQMNGQGILSILNPAAYPSAAVIRLTVSATIGSDVRRFGPLEIEVLAP